MKSRALKEMLKLENIGSKLKESILIMMNKVKSNIKSPEFMELARIVSIYKGKGDSDNLYEIIYGHNPF